MRLLEKLYLAIRRRGADGRRGPDKDALARKARHDGEAVAMTAACRLMK